MAVQSTLAKRVLAKAGLVGALLWAAGPAWSQDGADFGLVVDVTQKDATFVTQASFRLPLKLCQAWRYLIDYDAAVEIPGVIESKSLRSGPNKVRVTRVLEDRILFIPIRMRTVLDFTELPNQGTDFVQVEGQTKSHQGAWRLQADGDATVFRYNAVTEPDSALPNAVIRYFVSNRLRSSFVAMAQAGASRRDQACP